MKIPRLTRSHILPAAFLTICLSAKAQKLPNAQTVNVLAPVDVKTDGKAAEWGNQFEAYNKSTSVYYTMANDDNKLYLTIQATDATTATKILDGGITLTLKNTDNYSKPVSITYPLLSANDGRSFILSKIKSTQPLADSDLYAVNRQLSMYCKEIKVGGIKGVRDTLVTVDNNEGIKVAMLFDHRKAITYELAISLKYLDPFVNSLGTFNYTISLNDSNPAYAGFSARYTLAGR